MRNFRNKKLNLYFLDRQCGKKQKKQNQKTDKETAISIRFASIHTSTWQYLIIGFVIVGGVGSRSTQSQRCYIVVAYEKTNYVTSTMLSISEVFGHTVQQKKQSNFDNKFTFLKSQQ